MSALLLFFASFVVSRGAESALRVDNRFVVTTTVVNAYPNTSVNAFVTFEEDSINRLKYGEKRVLDIVYEQHEDFIVQFKREVTDTAVDGLVDYGFLQAAVTAGSEALMVLSRRKKEKGPAHNFVVFDKDDIQEEFSKLYFVNALWSEEHTTERGINLYGLYNRTNVDGSKSESVAQLALGVAYNTGREIDLEPGVSLQLKGYFDIVNSVEAFKLGNGVVTLNGFAAEGGRRHIMVAHGVYNSSHLPTQILVGREVTSRSSTISADNALALLILSSLYINIHII